MSVACRSFSILSSLAESLDMNQISKFVFLATQSLKEGDKAIHKNLAKELCRTISRVCPCFPFLSRVFYLCHAAILT